MLLEVRDLRTGYGAVECIREISFTVAEGDCLAILGPNGAGKSTLLKSISGLLPPWGGDILWNGRSIKGLAPHKMVGLGLAHVMEGRRLFPTLTVKENLDVAGLSGQDKSVLADILDIFPRLRERLNQVAGTLSGGEQQMLAIARALVQRPRLLMLDEPSLGLAPLIVGQLFTVLEQLKARGSTIILAEQTVKRAVSLCERAVVLQNGRLVAATSSAEVLADGQLQEAYLGVKEV